MLFRSRALAIRVGQKRHIARSFYGLRQFTLMFATVSASFSRRNFRLHRQKVAQKLRVFKIYLLDILLAHITGLLHANFLSEARASRSERRRDVILRLRSG